MRKRKPFPQFNFENQDLSPISNNASAKRSKYTIDFKKEAVKLAIEKNNNRLAVDVLIVKYPEYSNLDEKSVRNWIKDESSQPEDGNKKNKKQIRIRKVSRNGI